MLDVLGLELSVCFRLFVFSRVSREKRRPRKRLRELNSKVCCYFLSRVHGGIPRCSRCRG